MNSWDDRGRYGDDRHTPKMLRGDAHGLTPEPVHVTLRGRRDVAGGIRLRVLRREVSRTAQAGSVQPPLKREAGEAETDRKKPRNMGEGCKSGMWKKLEKAGKQTVPHRLLQEPGKISFSC